LSNGCGRVWMAGSQVERNLPLTIQATARISPWNVYGRELMTTTNKADLLQGTVDLLILKTLAPEPMHGYSIAQRIQWLSKGLLVVEEGSLYPCLHRMEEKGWIAAQWGKSEDNRRAKFYSLTRAGRKQLEEKTAFWEHLLAAITLVLQRA